MLNKTAAILLFTLLIFNWIGYQFYINIAENKIANELEASFNKNQYDANDLIEMKIPLGMAYQNVSSEYSRFDGEIEVGNIIYKYVLRRVANDTVYLKCLPNSNKMIAESKLKNYIASTNDIEQNNNGSSSSHHIRHSAHALDFDFVAVHHLSVNGLKTKKSFNIQLVKIVSRALNPVDLPPKSSAVGCIG